MCIRDSLRIMQPDRRQDRRILFVGEDRRTVSLFDFHPAQFACGTVRYPSLPLTEVEERTHHAPSLCAGVIAKPPRSPPLRQQCGSKITDVSGALRYGQGVEPVEQVSVLIDCFGCEFNMAEKGASPVSYTHLDVYKRQTLCCSARVVRPVHPLGVVDMGQTRQPIGDWSTFPTGTAGQSIH